MYSFYNLFMNNRTFINKIDIDKRDKEKKLDENIKDLQKKQNELINNVKNENSTDKK